MEFQLPANLRTALKEYDRPVPNVNQYNHRNQPQNDAPIRKELPLYPTAMIPTDVISEKFATRAIKNVYAAPCNARFTKMAVEVEGVQQQLGYISFYKNIWIAAWYPPAKDAKKYLYGFSIAYKGTGTMEPSILKFVETYKEQIKIQKKGRAEYKIITMYVTKEDIEADKFGVCDFLENDNFASQVWRASDFRKLSGDFMNTIERQFPDFPGENTRNRWDINRFHKIRYPNFKSYIMTTTDDRGDLDLKWAAKHFKHESILSVIDKPFFRNWALRKFEEFDVAYKKCSGNELYMVNNLVDVFRRVFLNIQHVKNIWHDCPLDFFQNHIELLETGQYGSYCKSYNTYNTQINAECIAWLNKNMPVATFFNILKNSNENSNFEYIWRDTLSMISRGLANAPKDYVLTPPRRWKLAELHDHVMAESWKLTTPDELLPQDLFPNPIKIVHENSKWSFFQPKSTHQMAEWGRAVRNCVGGGGYANRVMKKQEFIVFAMLDHQPQFTIQLEVTGGIMNVRQMVKYANARLDGNEEQTYSQVFTKALNMRNEELAVPQVKPA
jgi:hypothetical protein